VLFQNS